MASMTLAPVPQVGHNELIEHCLRTNSYSALRTVSCECVNGVVVLRGCLPTYYLKQVAQEAVTQLELEGVVWIDNQIEVVSPRPDGIGSEWRA